MFADNGKVNTEVIVLCESASLSATKHLPRQLKGKGARTLLTTTSHITNVPGEYRL